MQSAQLAMKNVRNNILGTIHLGACAFAPILNPCILAYRQKEPNVNFCYDRLTEFSGRRKLDLILTSSSNDYYTAESHFPVSCKLFEEDYFVILSPKLYNFPEEKTSIDLQETRDFPYIIMSNSYPYDAKNYNRLSAFNEIVGFMPRVAYEVNEFVFKVLLVSEGAGLAFLPEICLSAAKQIAPNIRIFSIEKYKSTRSVLLARRRRNSLSPAVIDFWNFALDFFHRPADVLP